MTAGRADGAASRYRSCPSHYLIYVGKPSLRTLLRPPSPATSSSGSSCVCYLAISHRGCGPSAAPIEPAWSFWVPYVLLVAAFVAEVPYARAPAFVMCVYMTMLSVARFGVRAAPVVAAMAVASLVVPVTIPSWHDSLAKAFNNFAPLAIPVVGVVTYAVDRLRQTQHRPGRGPRRDRPAGRRQRALADRPRPARPARALAHLDHAESRARPPLERARSGRAAKEIGEVEDSLARRSPRCVPPFELPRRHPRRRARPGQGAAPRLGGDRGPADRADVVDVAYQELFGWVVREGLTNVARHAHATRCTVTLSASAIEIARQRRRSAGSRGNGLAGLRERVAAAGAASRQVRFVPRGWRLHVAIDPAPRPP